MDVVEDGLTETIMHDLLSARPKHYPYDRYQDGFRIAQGIYLTKLSRALADALVWIIGHPGEGQGLQETRKVALEFDEGERFRREATFFRRHPSLRRAALKEHGLRCIACGFDFKEFYGALGEGYIELHHLMALSERHDLAVGKPQKTKVSDVVPLCANCHRVAHRERPAVSIERLQAAVVRR